MGVDEPALRLVEDEPAEEDDEPELNEGGSDRDTDRDFLDPKRCLGLSFVTSFIVEAKAERKRKRKEGDGEGEPVWEESSGREGLLNEAK